jgi:hypothetical protein
MIVTECAFAFPSYVFFLLIPINPTNPEINSQTALGTGMFVGVAITSSELRLGFVKCSNTSPPSIPEP